MSGDVSDWIEQAIPAGSGRYYAMLHSDTELVQKQKLVATLISVFSKLGFQSREIEVAKHKLDWWRNELEKDTFSHPVMVALEKSAITKAKKHQLVRLLNAYGSLLEHGSPSGDDQNRQFHLDTGSTACHLLCNSEAEIAALEGIGSTLSQLRCFRYLHQHVTSGLLCLPLSALQAEGISPALLTPKSNNAEVQKYITQALADLQSNLDKSISSFNEHIAAQNPAQRKNFKALYVYLILQSRLLTVVRKDGSRVLDEVARLTPIRNYWHALSAARKFNKLV